MCDKKIDPYKSQIVQHYQEARDILDKNPKPDLSSRHRAAFLVYLARLEEVVEAARLVFPDDTVDERELDLRDAIERLDSFFDVYEFEEQEEEDSCEKSN